MSKMKDKQCWLTLEWEDKKKEEYIKSASHIEKEDMDEALTFIDKLSRRSQLKFEEKMVRLEKNVISPQRRKYLEELE